MSLEVTARNFEHIQSANWGQILQNNFPPYNLDDTDIRSLDNIPSVVRNGLVNILVAAVAERDGAIDTEVESAKNALAAYVEGMNATVSEVNTFHRSMDAAEQNLKETERAAVEAEENLRERKALISSKEEALERAKNNLRRR